jgi:hypothetical protein
MSRQGPDAAFDADEAAKSNLLLEAQMLRAQGQDEAAAERFARAAALEEDLGRRSRTAGLVERSWAHRFSAAGCWAQAGNFYQALLLCQELLDQGEASEALRESARRYAQALRARRGQWYAEVALQTAGV